MTRLVSPEPDFVSEALRTLSVRSTVFCLSELRTPWAFRVEATRVAKFHLVLEGSALLLCDAEASVALGAGDLVVLPHGAAHTVADNNASPATPLERLLAEHPLDGGLRLRNGGTGALTRLLCGGFALAEGFPDSTLAGLPATLRIHADEVSATGWLEPVLATLKAEAEGDLPGASAIVAKIADVFLAQALRSWLSSKGRARLAGALIHDRPIDKATQALCDQPLEAWTLDRLARHVGLSRTALSTKFREQIGESPMRYLTKVRLSLAAARLSTGELTIHEIARFAGYQDNASFSKAFKREFGRTPGAYRDDARV